MNTDHLSGQQQFDLRLEMYNAVYAIFIDKMNAYNEKHFLMQGAKRTVKRLGSECFDIIGFLFQSIFDNTSGFLISKDQPKGVASSVFQSQISRVAADICVRTKTLKSWLQKLSDAGLLMCERSGGHTIMLLNLEIQTKIDEISAKYAK